MKKILKYLNEYKNLIIIVILIIIFVLVFSFKEKESTVEFFENDISNASKITCTYPQVASTYYSSNEVSISLNKPEKNPMIFTFSDFKSEIKNEEVLSFVSESRKSNVSDSKILEFLNNKGIFMNEDGTIEDSNLNPKLSYIDSTQEITTVPIVKLLDNEDKIIFIDGSGNNYISLHTIFKKKGVSTYSKSVDLLGIPSATLSMGTCTGY